MKNIVLNTKEYNDLGKYVKQTFGAEEFFIDDLCFFEASKDLWLQVI